MTATDTVTDLIDRETILRDLDEIVASQNKMLEVRGEARGAADARVKSLYEEHLAQVDRFLSRRACFATLSLEYADVLAAPAAQAARLNAFLGGSLDAGRMAAVADQALYRNRKDARLGDRASS